MQKIVFSESSYIAWETLPLSWSYIINNTYTSIIHLLILTHWKLEVQCKSLLWYRNIQNHNWKRYNKSTFIDIQEFLKCILNYHSWCKNHTCMWFAVKHVCQISTQYISIEKFNMHVLCVKSLRCLAWKQMCFASLSVVQNCIALLDIVLQKILRFSSFFQTCFTLTSCLLRGIPTINFVNWRKIYNIIYAMKEQRKEYCT